MLTVLIPLTAFLVGTIGVARAARLVTADAYPPMVWVRLRFLTVLGRRGWDSWAPLVECPFCFAPYAAAVDLAWAVYSGAWQGDASGWAAGWWLVNVWAAVSYLAAILVVRDEPPAED